MSRLRNMTTERTLVVVLFVLVLITFSLAQRDSKRLDRLYTVSVDKKTNVAAVKPEAPAAIHVR